MTTAPQATVAKQDAPTPAQVSETQTVERWQCGALTTTDETTFNLPRPPRHRPSPARPTRLGHRRRGRCRSHYRGSPR